MDALQILAESLPEILAIVGTGVAAIKRFNRADRELQTELKAVRKVVGENTDAIREHGEAIAELRGAAGIPKRVSTRDLTPVEGTRGRGD